MHLTLDYLLLYIMRCNNILQCNNNWYTCVNKIGFGIIKYASFYWFSEKAFYSIQYIIYGWVLTAVLFRHYFPKHFFLGKKCLFFCWFIRHLQHKIYLCFVILLTPWKHLNSFIFIFKLHFKCYFQYTQVWKCNYLL